MIGSPPGGGRAIAVEVADVKTAATTTAAPAVRGNFMALPPCSTALLARRDAGAGRPIPRRPRGRPRRPARGRPAQSRDASSAQQLAGDHQLLDLARALV